jgi:RimJ/RimL family protein N-acetyltransferase
MREVDVGGTVEVGYSVLPAWQRRGYASEMVQTLVDHAFTFAGVERIIAHTTEANLASIAVLLHCGSYRAGAGRETGALRFERSHIARGRYLVSVTRADHFRYADLSVLIPQACVSRHLSEMMDRIAKGPEDVKKSVRAADELP